MALVMLDTSRWAGTDVEHQAAAAMVSADDSRGVRVTPPRKQGFLAERGLQPDSFASGRC